MQSGSVNLTSSLHPLLRFITDRKYRWLQHTLFIIVCLVLAFKGDIAQKQYLDSHGRQSILIADGLLFIVIMALLYFIILVLIPQLLFRSRLLLFFLCLSGIAASIYFLVGLIELYFVKPVLPSNAVYEFTDFTLIDFIQKTLVIAVVLGCVTGLKVFKKWITDLQRMNELQQVNLRTELEQLKSQVNPHFLFNTLNNLLVLMKTDTEKASKVLLGLSDLLRYQLYDSARDRILLSKDIDFMENLLTLEKIRKSNFDYSIHTEGNINGQTLPPFLFIPFVENAIKHGASTEGHSYLAINFSISDNKLHFTSENSKPLIKNSIYGGLGLGNIKRRLELLYPDKHTLEIIDNAEKYVVKLIIPL